MAKAMPSLSLDVEQNSQPQAHSPKHHSPAQSGSSSPVRPTYSPITPVLGATRLATPPPPSSNPPPPPPQRIYTHSQPPQAFIPAPLPPRETVSLDTNPDALALRSALSILQLQSRRATSDIRTLHELKARVAADPTAFAEALSSGKLKPASDPLFAPSFAGGDGGDTSSSSDDDEDDGDAAEAQPPPKDTARDSNGDITMAGTTTTTPATNTQSWPPLPTLQSVVRTPPINWTQYGVVGDSLDKLHADQVTRPPEGVPVRIGPEGQVIAVPVDGGGAGGKRHEGLGVAAPYVAGRDRIEKVGKKRQR